MRISDFSKDENHEIFRDLKDDIERYLRTYHLDPYDLDEILQETIIIAWNKLDTLKDKDKLFIWTKKIAKNKLRRYRKYQNSYADRHCSLDDFGVGADDEYGKLPEQLVYRETEPIENTEIFQLIMELGEPDSTILILHDYYKENFREIAKTLNLNHSTVRSISKRAKDRLREKVFK